MAAFKRAFESLGHLYLYICVCMCVCVNISSFSEIIRKGKYFVAILKLSHACVAKMALPRKAAIEE